MQMLQNLQGNNSNTGALINHSNYGKENLSTISNMSNKSTSNEEFYLVEKNLYVNLDGLDLEEGNLKRNLFTDQHNRGFNSEDYNRTTNPVSVRNSAIFTIQASMDNTMGYPSAIGGTRQQLVVTHKLPQFTSFIGDNWKRFITKWIDYSTSVGSDCRSISDSTPILCKQ